MRKEYPNDTFLSFISIFEKNMENVPIVDQSTLNET
jgi:hypothetical protein